MSAGHLPSLPVIPPAAIQAAHDAIRQMEVSVIEGACCGKPDAERTIAERVLRAALPHLLDNQAVDRAAEALRHFEDGPLAEGDLDPWYREAAREALLRAETERLRRHITQARDLVAEAYRDDEPDDSPGNMAYAVLTAALGEPERDPGLPRCPNCGHVDCGESVTPREEEAERGR